MKPTITKLKNARGRITGYRAAIGPIEADGKTPAEATEACERATLDTLSRLERCRSVRALTWQGRTFVVAPTLDGWSYWLDTFSQGYSNMLPPSSFEDASDRAMHHLAQHVWNHDVEDDAAFVASLPSGIRSDLTGWIRFQRAYKIREAEGRNDNETHRLACEDSYKDSPELFRRAS